MNLLEIARQTANYTEIAPGEYAGPCPACGGAMRFRIRLVDDRGACNSCDVTATSTTAAAVFGVGVAAPAPVAIVPAPEPRPLRGICRYTAQDGRTFYLTDDPAAYARLVREGAIVFDCREMAIVQRSGLTAGHTARFLDLKERIPGCRIDAIEPDPGGPYPWEQVNQPRTGECYWSK